MGNALNTEAVKVIALLLRLGKVQLVNTLWRLSHFSSNSQNTSILLCILCVDQDLNDRKHVEKNPSQLLSVKLNSKVISQKVGETL